MLARIRSLWNGLWRRSNMERDLDDELRLARRDRKARLRVSDETPGWRVHALLGTARAIDERDQHEDRRDPVQSLRDG